MSERRFFLRFASLKGDQMRLNRLLRSLRVLKMEVSRLGSGVGGGLEFRLVLADNIRREPLPFAARPVKIKTFFCGRKKEAPDMEVNELDLEGGRIYAALDRWRREEGAFRKRWPRMILPDEVALAVAFYKPNDLCGLLEIKGMGGYRLKRYGQKIIELAWSSAAAEKEG